MRCKNCKKKIENPNLLRCPCCGKQLVRKKKIDARTEILSVMFVIVTIAFVVLSFFSFFFRCDYYSTPVMMIASVVLIVAVPFLYGNFKGMKSKISEIIAAVVSIPFLINWGCVFLLNSESLDRGGLYSTYYFSILLAIVLSDILLILKSSGIIKSGRVISWIVLGMGIFAATFSVFFYIYISIVKAFAILIIAVEAFTPNYMAFHVLMKDEQNNN